VGGRVGEWEKFGKRTIESDTENEKEFIDFRLFKEAVPTA
jgi:hypothetical protein